MNGAATRCAEATAEVLAAAGIVPTVHATIGDNAALLALVVAGHGVTIVPELILRDRAAEVVVSEQALGVERTIFGVTRTAIASRVQPLIEELSTVHR